MKECAVHLIAKEEIDYLKDDKRLIEFITNELTKRISERLIQVIEANDDIIVKKPVLRVSEYRTTYSVEYRKTVEWEPLVRCKDCKHNSLKRVSGNVFCDLGIGLSQIYDFCSLGERRDNVTE